MKPILMLVVALLVVVVAAPASAQYCTVPVAATHAYACTTDKTGAQSVPVSKAWFKQHCHIYSDGTANCDTYPTAQPLAPKDVAQTPHGLWHNLKVGAEYGAAITILAIIIAGGGGGAFQ